VTGVSLDWQVLSVDASQNLQYIHYMDRAFVGQTAVYTSWNLGTRTVPSGCMKTFSQE
jgi:hypothetical protein